MNFFDLISNIFDKITLKLYSLKNLNEEITRFFIRYNHPTILRSSKWR